jgi:hypothetical protein
LTDPFLVANSKGVGINSFNAVFNAVVYPNPSNGSFTVSFESLHKSAAVIRVIDITGKTVYSVNHDIAGGNNYLSLDISSLTFGIYLLQIETNEGKSVSRIVLK